MQRQFRSLRNTAFTLIEILVVIAIIALLAAILFPVFARARENARRADCQSNLKQIGMGILQYAQDYDERLPYTVMFAPATPNSPLLSYINSTPKYFTSDALLWGDFAMPYIKSTQIFRCPSTSKKNTPPPAGGTLPTWTGSDPKVSPAYGACLFKVGGDTSTNTRGGAFSNLQSEGNDVSSTSLAEFTDVAETFMVGELQDSSSLDFGCCLYPSGQDSSGRVVGPTHFDGSNFLYADGHVKWLTNSKAHSNSNYYWKRDKSFS